MAGGTGSGRGAWRSAVLVTLCAAIVFTGGALIVRHEPFYLPALDEPVVIEEDGTHRVFGYATLTNPVVRYVVTGRPISTEPARLADHRRVGRDLEPEEGEYVEGRVFEVSPEELRRLDRYERLGERYERVRVELEDGAPAWIYLLLEPADDGVPEAAARCRDPAEPAREGVSFRAGEIPSTGRCDSLLAAPQAAPRARSHTAAISRSIVAFTRPKPSVRRKVEVSMNMRLLISMNTLSTPLSGSEWRRTR